MTLQLIKNKPFTFRANNKEYEYVKPYYLCELGKLNLIKGVVKGSTLAWNIEGETITYLQLKQIIK